MPLGIDILQILLHMFNVVILFGGLYFLLYGPVKKFMDNREEQYRKLDEDTKAALEDAQKLKDEYDKQLQDAADEILEQRQEVNRELQELRRQKTTEAQEEARQILKKAEAEAEHRKMEIIAGAKGEITNLVVEATDKLLMNEDTGSFYDAFLDDAERSARNE